MGDYIVVRASADLPEGFLPDELNGMWFDLGEVPQRYGPPPGSVAAVPTGRFEAREDGAVAEVWEVRP